jgi:hypothetical protein
MCKIGAIEQVLTSYENDLSEPYTFTVYDRIFSDFPARDTVCTPYMVLANPT